MVKFALTKTLTSQCFTLQACTIVKCCYIPRAFYFCLHYIQSVNNILYCSRLLEIPQPKKDYNQLQFVFCNQMLAQAAQLTKDVSPLNSTWICAETIPIMHHKTNKIEENFAFIKDRQTFEFLKAVMASINFTTHHSHYQHTYWLDVFQTITSHYTLAILASML